MLQERTIPVEQAFQEAEQLQEAGKLADAEAMLRQILDQQPRFHPAYHSLGIISYKVGKLELAADFIEEALKINPDIAIYYRNLCELYRRTGRLDEARQAGEKAVELNRQDPQAWYNLGLAYSDNKQLEKAANAYQQVIKREPKNNLAYNNLGTCLEKLGKVAAAETAYKNAIDIDKNHAEAQNNLGAIYSEQGKLDQARACFNAAIKAQPLFVDPHYNLSSLKSYDDSDEHLKALENIRLHEHELPYHSRIRYHFAIGKALEDAKRYDEAFAAYKLGNELQHGIMPYSEEQADETWSKIINTFNPELMEKFQGQGTDDKTPIFIVGMPRSGTTLIEQVLDSHGKIFGAGELAHLDKILTKASEGQFLTDWVNDIKPEKLKGLGNQYIKSVRDDFSKSALRISDKMPANFFYIGMIKLMMPNAKIIHAMRDPMDSCLSCYGRLFNDSMAFAYDLENLGNYYVRYIKMMQHWHDLLPEGSILDVKYEDTIADFDQQARRIIDYLELDWDDNCLKFYDNTRSVKTASVAQVRKPIYNTSVARSDHFRKHLDPLYNIVKDYR